MCRCSVNRILTPIEIIRNRISYIKLHAALKATTWYTYNGVVFKLPTANIIGGTVFALVPKGNERYDLFFKNPAGKVEKVENISDKIIKKSLPFERKPPFSLTPDSGASTITKPEKSKAPVTQAFQPTKKQPAEPTKPAITQESAKVTQHKVVQEPSKARTFTITYCIGDIHGMFDKLSQVVKKILADHKKLLKTYPTAKFEIVTVGDYIDRGPESKQVIDLLKPGIPGFEMHCLMGNHEHFMIESVKALVANDLDNNYLGSWLMPNNGGPQTLESYGFKFDISKVSDKLIASLTNFVKTDAKFREHLAWIESLPLTYVTPEHIFVHAGIDTKKTLAKQDSEALLWTRSNRFFDHKDMHEGNRRIVHGHTPLDYDLPEITKNRISLDTGCGKGGVLTCVVFEPSKEPRLIQSS